MSEIDILELVPLELLFVVAFAVIPIVNTIYEEGWDSISLRERLAFGVILAGAVMLAVLSMSVGRNQFNVWPPLLVMAGGFLWYLKLMRDRDQLHEEPEMGGTSYE
ncbi:hypothetical protein ACFOZ7_15600 [Natribaculum luteum]|uniref:DUF1616 domain-containing protein n=1 Tax=Natribaculum luteum TaxID=1586232 RepID=A0ABD5P2B9_9EURY|nr:hypothetical protein [Natribaculum luteum]